jgi:beta-phosphoglucomutase
LNISKLAILWDLDGTIVDTTDCHFESWAAALKQHGYDLNRDLFISNFGRNNQTSLPLYLGFTPEPALSVKIIELKEQLFRQRVSDDAKLVSGVELWLSFAKNSGIRQVVASSAGMKNITTVVSAFDLVDYFDLLVSGSDLPAKPEPDIFLTAADMLECSPENCIVVEDSPAGIGAAKKAGMVCIGVVTSHSESQLASADLVLKDFNIPFLDIVDRLHLVD